MLEAEQTCIGGIAMGGEVRDVVMDELIPSQFLNADCREFMDAACRLRDSGREIDMISLANEFRNEVGDTVQMLQLLREYAPTAKVIKGHVQIVRDSWIKSRLLEISTEIKQLSQETGDGESMIESAMGLLTPLSQQSANVGFDHIAKASKDFIREITESAINGTQVTGLKTGFSHLDAKTGGFQKGDFIVVGGRPSHAKTATCMAMAHFISREKTVLVFSAEMAVKQLAMRSVSMYSQIDFDRIRQGQITGQDSEALKTAQKQHECRNLYVDDRSNVTIGQLRSRAKAQARKTGCDLVVVDYLTLIHGRSENRVHEISEVSTGLKALAKELDCPVVAIAQLSRSVEQRPDKRPVSSDLRDSGTIEQDADVIAFCYLDEKYDPDSPRAGILEFIIRKQRQGSTGSVFFDFDGSRQTITQRHDAVPSLGKKTAPRKKLASI